MRQAQTKKRHKKWKRHVLAASLVAVSSVGCSMPSWRRSPLAVNRDPSPTEKTPLSVAADTATPGVVESPIAAQNQETQPVVYNENVMLSAPNFALLLAEEEGDGEVGVKELDDEETVDKESEDTSFTPNSFTPNSFTPNSLLPDTQPVEYFLSIALTQHPQIAAARQRAAAAKSVIPQVTALADPVFTNQFSPIQDQAIQTAAGRIGHQMALSQSVPWPEKLRTRGAIASREVQMAQAEVDRIEREITESVRLAYYEVWFADRAIEIIEETRNLLEDLAKVAEARYRSGGTQQDVLRAQLESDRLDDQLIVLTRQKEVAQANLATLLQQPISLLPQATKELGLTNVPEQLDALVNLAEQCNPELRGLTWEIQRDRQREKLACLQKYPDFQLGLNYSIINDDVNVLSGVANGHDAISFTVGTTLPIWRDKINAGIREAAFRRSSTAERLEAQRDSIHGRLRGLLAEADALVEQTEIYENRIVPRTEDTLKLSIADYRGKRTDFFTLIETYRQLLAYETQLARFKASLAATVAKIDRTVGCP